jgi:hypothetical protein
MNDGRSGVASQAVAKADLPREMVKALVPNRRWATRC